MAGLATWPALVGAMAEALDSGDANRVEGTLDTLYKVRMLRCAGAGGAQREGGGGKRECSVGDMQLVDRAEGRLGMLVCNAHAAGGGGWGAGAACQLLGGQRGWCLRGAVAGWCGCASRAQTERVLPLKRRCAGSPRGSRLTQQTLLPLPAPACMRVCEEQPFRQARSAAPRGPDCSCLAPLSDTHTPLPCLQVCEEHPLQLEAQIEGAQQRPNDVLVPRVLAQVRMRARMWVCACVCTRIMHSSMCACASPS